MSDSPSVQLYKWITEEMGYIPRKSSGSSESVLSPHNLDFLMASQRDLCDHLMKHVHSVSKVQHVRKNILLNRLKKNNLLGIQKCDKVGNKIRLLGEVKHAQAKLREAREESKEMAKTLKNETSLLKIAVDLQRFHRLSLASRRCHLQNIADNAEKRCMLLEMGGENIRVLTEVFSSSSKCISLVKTPSISMHSSNMEHHSTIASVEEFTNEPSNVAVIPSVSVECKMFLKECVSMVKDLVDENGFMDFDPFKVYNAMSETKKNKLQSFISDNAKNFSGQHLFETLLSLISEKYRKNSIFYDGLSSTVGQKIYGEEQINDLEHLLLEKLTHFHASVTHDFAIAAQEKVVALQMKNELKSLMSSLKKNIHKMFPDNEMQEKIYELIEIMTEEASYRGATAYLMKSVNEMMLESSENSPMNQMSEQDDQLKSMEVEMLGHKRALRHLQSMQKVIDHNITSNRDKVCKFLVEIKSEMIKEKLSDVEILVELAHQEMIVFNEYPLECHRKSSLLGKEVMDSQLLMTGHTLADMMREKESNYARWVKLTLGMAPYSSTEHILALVSKTKALLELLSGTALNFENRMLQSCIDKVPGLLKCLEEDEKKSEGAIKNTCNMIKKERSEAENEMEKAISLCNTWN